MKIQNKKKIGGGVGGGGGSGGQWEGSGWGGGHGGCERRIEVFVKIQKKKNWGGGVRWGGGSVVEGVRWGGVGFGGAGVRVDVNAMLGVGVMWGMGDVNQE